MEVNGPHEAPASLYISYMVYFVNEIVSLQVTRRPYFMQTLRPYFCYTYLLTAAWLHTLLSCIMKELINSLQEVATYVLTTNYFCIQK